MLRRTSSVRRRLFTCTASLAIAAGLGTGALAQELVIAMPATNEPASLDGHIDPYQSTWLINSFIADPLVVFDPDGNYLPGLATGWENSEDGSSWTLTLREGVTFQDGTPFNAEAVKTNLERILAPETASAQLASDIGPIASITVDGEHKLTINYDTPWITLLDALRRTPIWSPTAMANFSLADFDKNLVGTGPFTLAEWVQNDHISMKRWDGYGGWNGMADNAGPVSVESLTIRFVGEDAVLGQFLQAGEVDIVFGLPALFVDLYADNPDYKFISKGQAGTGLQMVMNIRNPPLNDIRVRRALHMGRNMAAVNDIVYDGLYGASDGPLNNIHPCFWDGATDLYPNDPDQARALLEDAGWVDDGSDVRKASGIDGVEDGAPLTITYTILHHKEIGEVLQAQYRDIGIDLQIEAVPGPVQLDKVQRRDFQLMYERQRSPSPLILDQVWNSKWDQPGGWAWTGYVDAELDGYVNQLRSIGDQEARCEVAIEAQKIIMDQALMLPTLSQPIFVAMAKNVDGFQIGAEGNWFFLQNVSISE